MQHIDLSYQRALPILPFQTERITILLVGLGGTGSFLARHVACLVSLLAAAGKKVTLTFIDPDRVESVNIPRQNFCSAELGRYKAETLATRYAQAFGVEIACIPDRFSPEMVRGEWNSLTILVGCVDNAAARVTMGQALAANEPRAASQGNRIPHIWWLDLGNGLDFGQVLLGSTDSVEALAPAFALSGLPRCSLLPSPLLQEPGLREPRPEEQAGYSLSCAEQLVASAQAMTINATMADEGADYLYRLLITGDLRKFTTYLDLPSGTKRSSYTTPETLAKVIGRDPAFFLPRHTPLA